MPAGWGEFEQLTGRRALIQSRAGFTALLDQIGGNGVGTAVVEDASRFARELITQELGILARINRAVCVLTANAR